MPLHPGGAGRCPALVVPSCLQISPKIRQALVPAWHVTRERGPVPGAASSSSSSSLPSRAPSTCPGTLRAAARCGNTSANSTTCRAASPWAPSRRRRSPSHGEEELLPRTLSPAWGSGFTDGGIGSQRELPEMRRLTQSGATAPSSLCMSFTGIRYASPRSPGGTGVSWGPLGKWRPALGIWQDV